LTFLISFPPVGVERRSLYVTGPSLVLFPNLSASNQSLRVTLTWTCFPYPYGNQSPACALCQITPTLAPCRADRRDRFRVSCLLRAAPVQSPKWDSRDQPSLSPSRIQTPLAVPSGCKFLWSRRPINDLIAACVANQASEYAHLPRRASPSRKRNQSSALGVCLSLLKYKLGGSHAQIYDCSSRLYSCLRSDERRSERHD
jgi:hypothetical protein